jgi:hypothetical protein
MSGPKYAGTRRLARGAVQYLRRSLPLRDRVFRTDPIRFTSGGLQRRMIRLGYSCFAAYFTSDVKTFERKA